MKLIITNNKSSREAGNNFGLQLSCQVIESSRRQRLCQFPAPGLRQESSQLKSSRRQESGQVLRQESGQGKKAGGKDRANGQGKNHTTCSDRFRGVRPVKAPNVIPNNIEALLGAAKKLPKKFYNIFRACFISS